MLRTEKLIPMHNGIVTTANKYPKNGIIDDHGFINYKVAGKLKEYQTVIAVGRMAESAGVQPGQKVMLNYMPYFRIKHQNGKFNEDDNTLEDVAVTIEDVPSYKLYDKEKDEYYDVLCLFDRDISAIVEGDEIPEKEPDPDTALEVMALENKIKSNHIILN